MIKNQAWLMAAFVLCSSLYAQSPGTNESISTNASPLQGGYNASAAYPHQNSWDVFISTDYIYWAWQQDSLMMGQLTPTDIFSGTTQSIFQNPGYASGFQVGIGFNMPNMDHWNLYANYTWYQNSDKRSINSDEGRTFQTFTGPLPYINGSYASEIKMHFDAVDLLLQRPFYLGKKLTANISAGLSALWITQKLNTTTRGLSSLWIVADALDSNSSIENESITIDSSTRLKQTSWGLGPKFALDTNWLLGSGWKILADLSAGLLYTQYNLNQSSEGTALVNAKSKTALTHAKELHNYSVIRPITTALLGIGWDRELSNDRYHIDISAGYDFNVYWNYNMLDFVPNKVTGNMYLQGLNIRARLDF